jgi:hypothetical protein
MTPSAFRVDASLVTPEQENISEDALRAQVMKMLRSPAFSRSPRLSRFLRFSVEQTLLHRQDNLKEYSIGLEVFERPESFDPRMDSIVRVVARRLRTVVEAYYADEGRTDPILICFRSGSYVPTFRPRTEESDRKAGVDSVAAQNTVLIVGRETDSFESDGKSTTGGDMAAADFVATKLGVPVMPLSRANGKEILQRLLDGDANVFVLTAGGDLTGLALSVASKEH